MSPEYRAAFLYLAIFGLLLAVAALLERRDRRRAGRRR